MLSVLAWCLISMAVSVTYLAKRATISSVISDSRSTDGNARSQDPDLLQP